MITESFDENKVAMINPQIKERVQKCDVIIATFSNLIEDYVVQKFKPVQVGEFRCVNGDYPVYIFEYGGKKFGFFKTLIGSAASVGMLEDVVCYFDCRKVLVFGSAGTLDKDCYGKVMIPTMAYRDEGTSYHYAKAEEYIEIKNSNIVAGFMEKYSIPHKLGKTWTTDAFYRETERNFIKRKQDGCVVVDMECSAMQAVCNFRGLELYYFFLSGDLLDAPEWDENGLREANHNFQNFDIALHLACEI